MRRTSLALLGLACAAAAFATPAAANFYTIDPLSRELIYHGPAQDPRVQQPQAHRP